MNTLEQAQSEEDLTNTSEQAQSVRDETKTLEVQDQFAGDIHRE